MTHCGTPLHSTPKTLKTRAHSFLNVTKKTTTLTFFPTDITYHIKDGKAVITLFGRTTDGKQICILDDTFEPYFTVVGGTEEELLALKQDNAHVTRVEKTTRNLNETPTECFHVFVDLPKSVPLIKDLAREKGYDCYEFDILFTRRYLIDRNLTPLVETIAEAERIPSKNKVETYLAKKITQNSTNTLAKPRALALDIETYNPDNKLNSKQNPILMIGLFGDDFKRVITWKDWPKRSDYVEVCASEADMLKRTVELIEQYAPDMLVGYFTDGFDFPYLSERAKHHKLELPLGLDNSPLEILGRSEKEAKICGIPHIDLFKFVRRVIARSLKTDSYSLDAVSKELLGAQKLPVDMNALFKLWDEPTSELDVFAQYNLQDCKLTYDLFHKLLPTLLAFVRLIHLPPFDINRMAYSMLVEWYLIVLASRQGEIIPRKPDYNTESSRIKDRVQGAFVYEPKPGLYSSIAVFDYRSLYPSIIASHNISRGMVNCSCCTDGPTIETDRGTFRYCQKRKGLFARTISNLILVRADIKKQLKKNKDPFLAAQSEALKVLANSFYGYMGFAPARFYCIECAESTTAWARHYIHQAINTAKSRGFQVLYSDTDSIFLLLEKKTKEDALKLMEEINEKLPGLMELDYEGYYPSGIFVSVKAGEGGAKKKYALLSETGNLKIKGFETVRRNTSYIAKDCQERVLEIVLKERDTEKAKQYVRSIIDGLRKNTIPLEKLIIRTQLTKDTDKYASVGPHVAVAQLMKARGDSAGAGTIVKYIVVKGKGKIRDKVKLPDEATQDEYDGEYYITNQVIPAVERIFAVFGISEEDLAGIAGQSSLSSW